MLSVGFGGWSLNAVGKAPSSLTKATIRSEIRRIGRLAGFDRHAAELGGVAFGAASCRLGPGRRRVIGCADRTLAERRHLMAQPSISESDELPLAESQPETRANTRARHTDKCPYPKTVPYVSLLEAEVGFLGQKRKCSVSICECAFIIGPVPSRRVKVV